MAAQSFLELAERLVSEPLEKAELRDAMIRDDVAGWLGERGFGDLDPEDVTTAMAHVADAMPPRVAAELGDDASLEGLADVDLVALGLDDLDDYRPIGSEDELGLGPDDGDLDDVAELLADVETGSGIDADQLDDDPGGHELDARSDEDDEDVASHATDEDAGPGADATGADDRPLDDAPTLPDVPTLLDETLDERGLGELPDLAEDAAGDLDDIDADLVDMDEDRGDVWQDDDF